MAASRQYMIPGEGFINETTKNQFVVPGWGMINSNSYTVVFSYCKYVFTRIGQWF